MRLRGIDNWPVERQRVTYPFVWYDDVFKPDELDAIVRECSPETSDATVFGRDAQVVDERVRVSRVNFVSKTPALAHAFGRINEVVERANDRYYGLDLNGYETMQYTEYAGEAEGRYDWHMDMLLGGEYIGAASEPRKLSLSLVLGEPGVDFEGGHFEFNMGDERRPRRAELRRGRVILFPSWMIHRVTPVTSGVRRSLVAWVTGPKFS